MSRCSGHAVIFGIIFFAACFAPPCFGSFSETASGVADKTMKHVNVVPPNSRGTFWWRRDEALHGELASPGEQPSKASWHKRGPSAAEMRRLYDDEQQRLSAGPSGTAALFGEDASALRTKRRGSLPRPTMPLTWYDDAYEPPYGLGRRIADVVLRLAICSVDPPQPFVAAANVTICWQVDPSRNISHDWVGLWWTPFHATYVAYDNVTSHTGNVTFEVVNARFGYVARYFEGNALLAVSENEALPEAAFPTQVRVTLFTSPAIPPTTGRRGSRRREEEGTSHPAVIVSWTTNRSAPVGLNNTVWLSLSPNMSASVAVIAQVTETFSHDEINHHVGLPYVPQLHHPFAHISNFTIRCGHECYNDFSEAMYYVHPGYFHHATVQGLIPNTQYYYRVGEGVPTEGARDSRQASDPPPLQEVTPTDMVSSVLSLVTPPLPSTVQADPELLFSVLYVADGGIGSPSRHTLGGATHNDPPINGADQVWRAIRADPKTYSQDSLAIMNGDISYARGWPYIWEVFHSQVTGILDRMPVLYTFGNHEQDYAANRFQLTSGGDSGGEAGLVASKRFVMHDEAPWYTIRLGPMTLIGLSTEHSVKEQVPYLESSLISVNRTSTPWVIVFLHRPLYTSNFIGDRELHWEFLMYADLFNKYQVDAVLTGHDHYYERMCHVSNGMCADDWPFVDTWTTYRRTHIDRHAPCVLMNDVISFSLLDCRSACANATVQDGPEGTTSCTGYSFDSSRLLCSFFNCSVTAADTPLPLGYEWSSITEILTKIPGGRAPIYIVDGSAGAEFSPTYTFPNRMTRYKDFKEWGYSRMEVTRTSWTWLHYHTNGSLVDRKTLTK